MEVAKGFNEERERAERGMGFMGILFTASAILFLLGVLWFSIFFIRILIDIWSL